MVPFEEAMNRRFPSKKEEIGFILQRKTNSSVRIQITENGFVSIDITNSIGNYYMHVEPEYFAEMCRWYLGIEGNKEKNDV